MTHNASTRVRRAIPEKNALRVHWPEIRAHTHMRLIASPELCSASSPPQWVSDTPFYSSYLNNTFTTETCEGGPGVHWAVRKFNSGIHASGFRDFLLKPSWCPCVVLAAGSAASS